MAISRAAHAAATALVLAVPASALAQTAPQAAPQTVTLPEPVMAGSLAFKPVPYFVDLGPFGTWYTNAVLSGLVLAQSSPSPADRNTAADVSNAQIIVQKIDGWWQFYLQAGAYALPTLGTPTHVTDASHTIPTYFGVLPQAFLKFQPTPSFSIEAGKLPTLFGGEDTFDFEDFNIERGLIWNQEPAVSRGVQVNYVTGPITLSLSLNDGYYSNRFNWLAASATWAVNAQNTVILVAGSNLGETAATANTVVTPTAQNNSALYNLIYTYNAAPWIITPYLQASHVPANPAIGISKSANTYAGALLADYTFNSHWQLAGRVAYIATDGHANDPDGTNLLYGPGSGAVSLTVTPTYTLKRYFIRAELSFVGITNATAGDAFGSTGNAPTQVRGLLEAGVIF